jgi:hypothetical protein
MMKAFHKYFIISGMLLLGIGLLVSSPVLGQGNRITATTKTSISDEFDLKELKNRQRRTVNVLVVSDIRNIAYGNRCVTEATRRLGFVYTPMPISEIERRSRFYYFMHNQITKFKIILKHGPGWKKKLRKSIARCG